MVYIADYFDWKTELDGDCKYKMIEFSIMDF